MFVLRQLPFPPNKVLKRDLATARPLSFIVMRLVGPCNVETHRATRKLVSGWPVVELHCDAPAAWPVCENEHHEPSRGFVINSCHFLGQRSPHNEFSERDVYDAPQVNR